MSLPHAKSESYKIFDAIARRYDVINTVLSAGLHKRWRRMLRRMLPDRKEQVVLDLATGTGDVALELIQCRKVKKVIGVDLSQGMIHQGRAKIRKLRLDDSVRLEVGDAQSLSYMDGQFDAASMSFGIRNVPDVHACLREIHRILKPGGRCLILEFALPESKIVRFLHLFYLRNILPVVGRLLSGHDTAYTYLNQTIEDFPYGQKFTDLMRNAGFSSAGYSSLSFGIVNLYWGDKAR